MPPLRSDDELIAALRRCAALVDGPLTSADYHRLHEPTEPGARTIGQRYGSWAGALEAVGLPSAGFRGRHRWKHADALAAVAQWASTAEDTRLPAYAAAAKHDPTLPLPDQLSRMFGGWRRTLAALERRGLIPERPGSDLGPMESTGASALVETVARAPRDLPV